MKRFLRLLALPPLLAALAGCTNDAASWQIEGKEHSLSLAREQRWLWSRHDLYIVATRMPECQRRHPLLPAGANAVVEVYQTAPGEFVLKQGQRLYRVETRTCETFQKLDAEPAGGLGTRVGRFAERDGELRFVAETPKG